MKSKIHLPILFALLFLPSLAMANPITPIFWSPRFHLLFGNIFIGILEGALLWLIFKAKPIRAILIMIAANYFSAWCGWLLLTLILKNTVNLTIENIGFYFFSYLLLAFLAAIFLEFFFVTPALRKKDQRGISISVPFNTSLKAAVLINAVSYIILVGWYLTNSNVSMITGLNVVKPDDLCTKEKYVLYYISNDNNKVMETDLSSMNSIELYKSKAGIILELMITEKSNGLYSLSILENKKSVWRDIKTNLPIILPQVPVIENKQKDSNYKKVPGSFPSFDLTSLWTYRVFYSRTKGLHGFNDQDKKDFTFALDTPFINWPVDQPVRLENNCVIMLLGHNQICILKPLEKEITLIGRGRELVVVKVKPQTEQSEKPAQATSTTADK